MTKPTASNVFQFKKFAVAQDQCAMKVGTDGILLAAWARVGEVRRILDIGTGTGLIALMLAQRQTLAQVIGVEIDQGAAKQAQDNVAASPFADRVKIIQGSIQDYTQAAAETFDLIASNPPFFSGGVLSENAGRAEVRHTVKLSHQDLLRSVQRLLAPDGSFCLVLPWLEGLRFMELAKSYHLYTWQKIKVSPSPEKAPNRLLLSFRKNPPPGDLPEEGVLSIYAKDGADAPRSEAYEQLTADFFLR
jgi:tRNA1Val (adenine37-N6)-methyltransferase